MSMIFMDSLDKYGGQIARMTDGLWVDTSFAGLSTTPAPPHGTWVFNLNLDGANVGRFALPDASQKKVGTGARYYFPAMPASNNEQTFLASFNDVANLTCARVYVMTTGAVQVVDAAGNILGVSPGPVFTANAWHHIECYTEIDGSGAGVFDVYVDGARRLHLTGLTMSNNAAIAQVVYGRVGGGGGAGFYMKDIFIYDTQGSFNHTSPIGDIQVLLLMPTANGVLQDWTATASPAWSTINETPPDDTSFISHDATSLPKSSAFAFADLPSNATGVKAVQIVGRQWKSDAGTATLQQTILSNATTAGGTTRPISTVPAYYWDVFETDPDTGAVWGVTAVNAAFVGVKRAT